MSLYRERAVVLRDYKLAEADKIVVFYSRGSGIVRGVAKGVRRTKSKFGSKLESGSVVDLQLYAGRNLDIVTQVERVESFSNSRSRLDLFCRAAVILELVEVSAVEGESNPALYKMLVGALRELDATENRVVLPAFIAKFLVVEGVQPLVDRCVRCGSVDHLVSISLEDGGTICKECRGGEPISDQARLALADLFSGKVRQVLDSCSPETVQELETFATRLAERHVERKLRSSAVLYEQVEL